MSAAAVIAAIWVLILVGVLVAGWRIRSWRDAHPSPWVEPTWADEQWWVNR